MYLVKPFTLYMNVIVHRMRLYGEDDSNALLKTETIHHSDPLDIIYLHKIYLHFSASSFWSEHYGSEHICLLYFDFL